MRAARAAAAVVLLLLLAGCTSIPVTGTVQAAPTEQSNDPGLVFVPNPPADGADPQAIVQGFVAAATEGAPYAVAAQFLTADFAQRWKPDERVLIHDDSWTTTAVGDDRVSLSVRVSGEVDAKGSYQQVARDRRLGFQLQKVDGQWRISAAPDGVLLSTTVFQSIFRPEQLRFFDPTWTRFVPDLRWFPKREDQPSRVVAALLAGPSAPIADGVTSSAFPQGTTLDDVSTVGGGVLSVSITTPGEPDADAATRMQQQLSSSLGVAPGLVRLVLNGRVASAASQLASAQQVLRPFVVADGRFGSLSGPQGTLREDTDLGPRIVAASPTAVTFSTRQRLAAVQVGPGTAGPVAIVTPDRTTVIDRRAPLAAPTLDQQGWVYTVPSDDPTGLAATSVKGQKAPIAADLGGSAVAQIEVSPDGTRMLVVVLDDGVYDASVAGILRAPDGTPTGLTADRYPVAVNADLVAGATWVDDEDVAVLTTAPDGQNQTVTVQTLGGFTTTLDRLSGARQIVGTSSSDDLRALLQNGDVNTSSTTTGWSSEFSRPVKVTLLAVQR